MLLTLRKPKKEKKHHTLSFQNMCQVITLSWLFLSSVFHQYGQCRSKIRLHILCSLILTYTDHKTNFCCEKHFNPFPNKPLFLRVYSTNLLKTLWKKDKLLSTSNFSFSHIGFYPFGELYAIFIIFEIVICKLFQCGRVQNLLFGKGLRVKKLKNIWD